MDNLVAWGQETLKAWRKQASALELDRHPALAQKVVSSEQSCIKADLSNRMQVQNKLAGVCTDMCKEVDAPAGLCKACPDFVKPDETPGVMTWPELLQHMDNLVAWGQETLKSWRKQASALELAKHPALAQKVVSSEQSCLKADLSNRMQVQNKLAGVCTEMCKEVDASAGMCKVCPGFVKPDETPGVMTWPELLQHMDNLVLWGQETLKAWRKQESALELDRHPALAQKVVSSEQSCIKADLSNRMQVQNKLAGGCTRWNVQSLPGICEAGRDAWCHDLARAVAAH